MMVVSLSIRIIMPVSVLMRKERLLCLLDSVTLRHGVVLEDLAFHFDGLIDPVGIVFPQEAVAAKGKTLEKTMFFQGKRHILRGAGAEVAARAIDR